MAAGLAAGAMVVSMGGNQEEATQSAAEAAIQAGAEEAAAAEVAEVAAQSASDHAAGEEVIRHPKWTRIKANAKNIAISIASLGGSPSEAAEEAATRVREEGGTEEEAQKVAGIAAGELVLATGGSEGKAAHEAMKAAVTLCP